MNQFLFGFWAFGTAEYCVTCGRASESASSDVISSAIVFTPVAASAEKVT